MVFYLLLAVPILLILGVIYANRRQVQATPPPEPEPNLDLTYRPPPPPSEPKHENPVSKLRDSVLARLSPEELVLEVLKECYDPEIPLNIVDLGLIYDVDLGNDELKVKMSLTAPGCPSSETISLDIQSKLLEAGFPNPKIQVVWDPPWTAERISEEGRKVLGI